jgi:RNA-binding protein Musashi
MNEDQDDDDDDEVDFNLGGSGNAMANHSTSNAMTHEDAPTPPFGTVHKASAKEDG